MDVDWLRPVYNEESQGGGSVPDSSAATGPAQKPVEKSPRRPRNLFEADLWLQAGCPDI